MTTPGETPGAKRPPKPANRTRLAALLLVAITLAVFAFPYFRGGSGDNAADDLPTALVDLVPIPKSKRPQPPSQALGTFEWFSTSLNPADAEKEDSETLASESNETNRRVWSSKPDARRWGLTITRGPNRDWIARCGNGIALKLIEQNRTAEMVEMVDAGGSAHWRVYNDRLESLAATNQWNREIEGSWNGDPAASLRHPVVNVSSPLDVAQLEWRAATNSGRFFKTTDADSSARWISTGWLIDKSEPDRLEVPIQTGVEYSLGLVITRTAGKPGLIVTLPMAPPSVTLEIDTPADGGWITRFRPATEQAGGPAEGNENHPEPLMVTLRKHHLQWDVTKQQIDARLDGEIIASWKAPPAGAASKHRNKAEEPSPLVLEFGKGSYEIAELKLIPRSANASSPSATGATTPPAWAIHKPPIIPDDGPRGPDAAIARNLIPLQSLAAPSADPPPPPKDEPEAPKEELSPPAVPDVPTLAKGNLLTQFNGVMPGFVSVNNSQWLLHRVDDHEVKVIFPPCLPQKYILNIKFRKEEGPDALIVCIPVGKRHALVMLNAYPEHGILSGVETDGPLYKERTNVLRAKVLELNRDYQLNCVVSANQFDVKLDGQSLAQWQGDSDTLRLDSRSPKVQGQMAILARRSAYKLLSVEVQAKR